MKKILMTVFISTFNIYGCMQVVTTTSPSPTASPVNSQSPLPNSSASATPVPISTPNSQNNYDLPLTALWRIEAGPSTTVEVKPDGTFNYQQQGSALYTRKLSSDEISKLKNFLNQIDLAKLAEGDGTSTDGSHRIPGTGDDYTMIVNGKEQTYTTRTFPNLTHTQDFINAARQLRSYLENLKK